MKKDKITIKAKSEGYRARSVYKLFSINKRYGIIKEGIIVLDLGCWPGSWLQVCKEIKCRKIIGVDVKRINPIKNVEFVNKDVLSEDLLSILQRYGKFDTVLSDLAPNTSGKQEIDNFKSFQLSERAFLIACDVLKLHGNFLVKIFQSEDSQGLLGDIRKRFSFVKVFKPENSKKRSNEIYIIAKNYVG
ncbi:RlmE family RNA methyltransferase [Candidatus Woesearchaeota archaeon]|nr:RlmE family RNA methyltransferase [Candidatus Woesearchaeota archaeon]